MLSRLPPNLNIHGKAGSSEQLTKGQHDSMRYKTDLESLKIEERDFSNSVNNLWSCRIKAVAETNLFSDVPPEERVQAQLCELLNRSTGTLLAENSLSAYSIDSLSYP